ncbi:unnamed protein product [Linum tenue]|uniref:Uncharacterized protein n=1 Tax=Linum tenue TaxID=586396 RepID=A0AAV0H575_9ROSI|nr:unnamed protein product [Linum tenue]
MNTKKAKRKKKKKKKKQQQRINFPWSNPLVAVYKDIEGKENGSGRRNKKTHKIEKVNELMPVLGTYLPNSTLGSFHLPSSTY